MKELVSKISTGFMTVLASAFGETLPQPYEGADRDSQELSSWQPNLGSANSDYLASRNTIVARARDLDRNSGWASGGVSRKVDNVVGSGFRLSAKPDYRSLGLTAEWAHEFALEAQSGWRLYAEDPDHYADATRHDTVNGVLGLAYRCMAVDGEVFAYAPWIDGKPDGKYATTIQMIDADRVINPYGAPDGPNLRSGIEIDDYGAPVAYNIRLAHPSDWPMAMKSFRWERIARETSWGRRQMLHAFEKKRPDQIRGISDLSPIIERLKMVDKYDKVELQAAVMNAIFAAYIESPFDHEMLDAALSGDGGGLNKYQSMRSEFHGKRGIKLNGLTIPKLFPGEKFGIQNAARPAAQFGEFEKACLRNIASGLGLSYEQLSQDWSSTNYSSARAALIEVWRGFNRARTRFAEQFATPWYMLWMEEAIDRGDLKLPKGGPDFYQAKGAYCRAKWIGPPRGWVDPVKEGQAAQIRMDSLLSTLEEECAEQGRDYEEVLDQAERENLMLKQRGLVRAMLTAKVLAPGEQAPESLVGDGSGNSGGGKNG